MSNDAGQPTPRKRSRYIIPKQRTRFSLDMEAEDYQAVCREWLHRVNVGRKTSVRMIILEAVRERYGAPS